MVINSNRVKAFVEVAVPKWPPEALPTSVLTAHEVMGARAWFAGVVTSS